MEDPEQEIEMRTTVLGGGGGHSSNHGEPLQFVCNIFLRMMSGSGGRRK